MNSSSELVLALSRFNRKERFWLLSEAIGEPFSELSGDFLRKIQNVIGLDIPNKPWWAFDYHFDWLYAVLYCGPAYRLDQITKPIDNSNGYVRGTQEDIDLIIAFDKTIIMIEAKLTTSWNNQQMKSKILRMKSLPCHDVNIHLILASPKPSTKLKFEDWPDWALSHKNTPGQPNHIILKYGDANAKSLSVHRCNIDDVIEASGGFWTIR